jgi:hypothetical protein
MNETADPILPFRHTLATLAYRAAKVLRGAPHGFAAFEAGQGVRTPGEILAHMSDVLAWGLSLARGERSWEPQPFTAWEADKERFFSTLAAFDRELASGSAQGALDRLFQGPIADCLTHVGQLGVLRRLAGAPVRGEDYSRASIEIGRLGGEQVPPVREFG